MFHFTKYGNHHKKADLFQTKTCLILSIGQNGHGQLTDVYYISKLKLCGLLHTNDSYWLGQNQIALLTNTKVVVVAVFVH